MSTYQRVKQLFTWQGLKTAVENFVKQCDICQQAKHELCKKSGMLQPLPIPDSPWQEISIDFIEGLPRSDGYTAILVVIDRFSKVGHFLPLKHPFRAASVAKVFLNNIVKLHGLPLVIVSDRDKILTSAFWKELFMPCLDVDIQDHGIELDPISNLPYFDIDIEPEFYCLHVQRIDTWNQF